jgi:hypothetical protein
VEAERAAVDAATTGFTDVGVLFSEGSLRFFLDTGSPSLGNLRAARQRGFGEPAASPRPIRA